MDWETARNIVTVVTGASAVIATSVSVAVYRRSRTADLTGRIESGDRAIRKHTDKVVSEMKDRQERFDGRLADIEDGIARIEAEQKHHLTARDLGHIHEKINRVAEDVSAGRAESKALNEQLQVVLRHLMQKQGG